MQAKTKKDWTQTMFVVNIAAITFIVGMVVGQFVSVVINWRHLFSSYENLRLSLEFWTVAKQRDD